MRQFREAERTLRAFAVTWVSRRCGSRELAVLLVEQNATTVLPVVDRAYVLDRGQVVATGNASELLATDGMLDAFLNSATPDRPTDREATTLEGR